jgi:hypothetical protein
MRTRKEIEKQFEVSRNPRYQNTDQIVQDVILEVLLDIRDILANPIVEVKKEKINL